MNSLDVLLWTILCRVPNRRTGFRSGVPATIKLVTETIKLVTVLVTNRD